mmetsp:Transcript_62733/g.127449  ORF Transcript_62733/g.127449 Transcript_62733/m.127449 type:complete len:222 (+) Transcript_62733:571-1236(+)
MSMLLWHLRLQSAELQVHLSKFSFRCTLQLQVLVLHPLHLVLMLCEALLLCIGFPGQVFLQFADLCLHILFILLDLLFASFGCVLSTLDLLTQRFQSVECLFLFSFLCGSLFLLKLLIQSRLLCSELPFQSHFLVLKLCFLFHPCLCKLILSIFGFSLGLSLLFFQLLLRTLRQFLCSLLLLHQLLLHCLQRHILLGCLHLQIFILLVQLLHLGQSVLFFL